MDNVLMVSGSNPAAEALTGFIRDSFGCNVRLAESGAHARTIIAANPSWELVIINVPLPDEQGIELAEYAAGSTPASCIVMVKAELAERLMSRADTGSIIVVAKPFSRQTLYQVLKAADTAIRRSWELYEENVRLERRINEIKLIDKAKFRLMQYRGMTEEEAHAYIEQYAMNKRKKKVIAASEIIDKIEEQYI